MDLLRVPSCHNIDVRDGDAWKQASVDVLVHGHAPSDTNEKDVFGSRAAAPARTQEVSAYMGDAPQTQKCDGSKRWEIPIERHHRTGRGVFHHGKIHRGRHPFKARDRKPEEGKGAGHDRERTSRRAKEGEEKPKVRASQDEGNTGLEIKHV